jgi:hypothetical protein
MPIELELTSLRLALQTEELNSTDISQRMNPYLLWKNKGVMPWKI